MVTEKRTTTGRRRRLFLDGAASTAGLFTDDIDGITSSYTDGFYVFGCAIQTAMDEINHEHSTKK